MEIKGSEGNSTKSKIEKNASAMTPDKEVSAEMSGTGMQMCTRVWLILFAEPLTVAPSRKLQCTVHAPSLI